MAADRGPFVDQSQSMNIHITDPTMAKITSMHFYGWQKGLKTGMYYLRTQAARDAIKFTVVKEKTKKPEDTIDGVVVDEKQQSLLDAKTQEVENNDQKIEPKGMVIIDDNDPNVCVSCGA